MAGRTANERSANRRAPLQQIRINRVTGCLRRIGCDSMGRLELIPGAELHVPWQCSHCSSGNDAKRRVSNPDIGQAKAFCVGAVQAVSMKLDLPPIAELVDTFHADIGGVDTITA